MNIRLAHISAITGGLFKGNGEAQVSHFIIDSRKKFNPESTLFVAIRGEQHDGHEFISDVYQRGIRCFMVEKIPDEKIHPEASWILVVNVLEAFQKLASNHRLTFTYPVVAISGSNAKTIVKEWIYQVLHRYFTIVRSPKSYNSQVGVALSVMNMETHHNLAVFEAGISEPDEMQKLQNILQPTIGIFTNIGDAHGKSFQSQTHKIREKLKLFSSCETLIYQKSQDELSKEIEKFARIHNIQLLDWSYEGKSKVEVSVKEDGEISLISLVYREKNHVLQLPFNDSASIENAIHTWVLAMLLGAKHEDIQQHFTHLSPVEMRLNQKAALNNCTLVCDFYNSDLTSLEIALNWADRQHRGTRKTIILSDIDQAGLNDKELFTRINGLLQDHSYDRLIGIGKRIRSHKKRLDTNEALYFDNTQEFIGSLGTISFENETILLKGGRRFHFEEIEKRLQKQVHNTVLEINMNALQHNLNFFRSKLDKSTELMVMVKAYSYGSGGHEIAHFLQHHGVQYLAVAYADEGVSLRQDGIKTPIMVMNSDEDSFDSMLEYDLEPEVFSFRSLNMLLEVLKNQPQKTSRIHIEFNSGMNRLGFEMEDAIDLTGILRQTKQLEVASIFSHLAASDITDMVAYTAEQIMRFNDFYETLTTNVDIAPKKHILNSAGILHQPESQFDLVRLGIGLYGIDPSEVYQDQLEIVGTLWSTISQIRLVKSLDGVGYGKHSSESKERRIAVVAIGYADGLNRGLSQGKGYFSIHGKPAPIVGNICMDMTMCDVTEIDCEAGDAVQVFGQSPNIIELAQTLKTIPYEVLTSVSQRVKRVFTEE